MLGDVLKHFVKQGRYADEAREDGMKGQRGKGLFI
jgi:hypothetical protein